MGDVAPDPWPDEGSGATTRITPPALLTYQGMTLAQGNPTTASR